MLKNVSYYDCNSRPHSFMHKAIISLMIFYGSLLSKISPTSLTDHTVCEISPVVCFFKLKICFSGNVSLECKYPIQIQTWERHWPLVVLITAVKKRTQVLKYCSKGRLEWSFMVQWPQKRKLWSWKGEERLASSEGRESWLRAFLQGRQNQLLSRAATDLQVWPHRVQTVGCCSLSWHWMNINRISRKSFKIGPRTWL